LAVQLQFAEQDTVRFKALNMTLSHENESQGFAIVSGVIDAAEREELISTLGPISGAGRRGLLSQPAIARLARSSKLLDLIRPHLPSDPFPVRAIYFDKTPDTNWLVPWHQDLTLALSTKTETPGFGPWSIKDGVPHAQPPIKLLEQMITIRIHLDKADASNGALRVLPGSHRLGRLSAEDIQSLRSRNTEFTCVASAGDALLMRPLLLHASSRSTSESHRRILHIEFAAFTLPPTLDWYEAASL